VTETASQNAMIRKALEDGETLTPLDAMRRFGCMRLGARVWDLRRQGLAIESQMVAVGGQRKRVAAYRMVQVE